nr:UDP-N-acetylglucosamine pyrophosphorylase [Ipomoea batatas]
MLKNVDDSKSTARPRSNRMPLRSIPNSNNGVRHFSRSTKTKKKLPEKKEQEEAVGGDSSLDRLLLVHSDLSSLVHQIDELVVQALTSKKEIKEIKSFADFLSEMQVSLKPWVSRFQKALSDTSTRPENIVEQPLESKVVLVPAVKEDMRNVVDSPEQCKWDSLVCSSPLVSWPADCTSECDRQLFLLTPLPQSKGLLSKFRESSKSIVEKIKPDQIPQLPSVFDAMLDMGDNLLDSAKPETTSKRTGQPLYRLDITGNVNDQKLGSIAVTAVPKEVSDIAMKKPEGTLDSKLVSPEKVLSRQNSILMTPCLKVSPPKSCVVLEPVSEYHYKGNLKLHKLTPYPSALQFSSESQDSESSTSQSSEELNVKYPELFGIKLGNQVDNRWKVADESPKWSPPKTCVLLEPPEDAAGECLIPETAPNPNQKNFLPKRISTQELGSKYELVESTPMMKEPESCIKIGKHPGENTLKRELWTKFEAASTHAICFNPPTTQKMALQKGFLDRLDEVSSDE